MTRVNPYRTATFMPQSLKDFTSAKNAQQTGVMAPCKGVQSLAYEVQECLLRPPSPAAVMEYAIGQLEPSANQSQQFAHDQPRSVLPCDTSSFTSPSNQITKVSELTEEGHGVSKKRRTGHHEDKSRIAPPIKVAETEKLARLEAPSVEQRPKQRSYNNVETELDELIYERDHGVNENETEKQEYKLPPSQISRYMLAREPASCRDIPAYSSSPSVTLRNAEGMKPLKTSSEGDDAENLETPLHDNALKLDSRPTNPRDISQSIENVIQSARTLPVLPIMVNTSIYNKRHLCSALHALQFQLYGHDHLEADFILNLKTACILVPLAYISANAEELLEKLVTLAFSFENLIVIFDLYPSRTNPTNQAALPDPWSPSTQLAFTQFEGRLKRQIMWKVASDSGFQHRVNVYLSDNASTLAALLRLHANDESMPAGTSVYRQLDENDIGDTFAWLSMDMEAEECQIRDGLQLNSAAALYIAHEYGAAAFLEACQLRNNNMELFDLLGSWNMKTTGDVVRSRAAEAKRVEDEESVTGIQSQVEDGFSAILSGEHHYTSLQDAGRQMFDVPPIAFVSNDNSSYGTDFEDIAVDQDLQVGGYPSAEHGPAYLQEPGPAFTTVTTNEEEPDELNLRYFDWN
ncbi:hypothetical protein QFC21_005623 [Naganishia friedmannii]|uniref:Uncharacterized protein n=1 Tax=Naganishia friedmannii TaxID=89922 RepID=A0ACC2V7I9_9TREE|nr:hypothetical protein QFC21_005623 [Naganishia friedmannii]